MIAITYFQMWFLCFLFFALAIFLIFSYFVHMLIESNEEDWGSGDTASPAPKGGRTYTKVVDCLVDPDFKLSCIFVSLDAIENDKFISGNATFTEISQNNSHIKLIRSGTGFRIYNHPTLEEGQWLSCR